jgi:hypothetical protein
VAQATTALLLQELEVTEFPVPLLELHQAEWVKQAPEGESA